MLRRLFFLFPDDRHMQSAIDELHRKGVPMGRIHVKEIDRQLSNLSKTVNRDGVITSFRTQSLLWNVNLVIFALAVITFLITLSIGEIFWIIAAFAIMIVSVFAGSQFVVHIPDVHLSEFNDAIKHGGLLLMVDVKASEVASIEDYVHRLHPEAAVGGVNWSMDAFGV